MKRVVCVGEILWDVIGSERFLGGAPLNVAANLAALGAEAWMLSAVGDDELGCDAVYKLKSVGVETALITADAKLPTGTAVVRPELDGNDRFELPFPVAYDNLSLDPVQLAVLDANVPDGIVFGTLASHRSPEVRRCVEKLSARFPNALKLYDVNLRKAYFDAELVSAFASACTVMKLNDGEAEILSNLLWGESLDIPDFASRAMERLGCRYVVVTKGGDGAEAFSADGHFSVSGIRAEVVDTVGAGDAFSAGFLWAMLEGLSLDEALLRGNECGAACVAHAGAFPV